MQSPALPVEIFHVLAKCLSKALVSSELPSLMASQYPSMPPRNTKRVGDGLLTEKNNPSFCLQGWRTEMWEDMMQDKIFQDKLRIMEMKELKQAANLNKTQSACFSKIHRFHFRH